MKPFTKVRRAVERHALLAGARGVVVAVSGGPDSVALLDMLMRVRDALPLHVAHLNHKLRAEDSDADAEFVRRLAERLNLPLTIECADVRAAAALSRRGIEETARELRYRFLLCVARESGADRIATGHTMSDQAETFLMRLVRGAGTRGLAAMRPMIVAHEFAEQEAVSKNQQAGSRKQEAGSKELSPASCLLPPAVSLLPPVFIVRPLLGITREEVEAYRAERGLEYRMDATNLTGEFTRNRVRRDVLPSLRAVNPQAVQAIARAAEHLAADQDALDHLAKQLLDAARVENADDARGGVTAYRVALLRAHPAGLQRRLLREAIRRASARMEVRGEITSRHVAAVRSLLAERASGKRARLHGGLEAWREYDAIIFKRADEVTDESATAAYAYELDAAHPQVEAGGLVLTIERGLPAAQYASLLNRAKQLKEERGRDWSIAVLDDGALPAALTVCPRRRGARAQVAGHRQTIKLKKLMIAHTIPASRRATWPVVLTPDGRYVWSPGLPPAVDFAARGETRTLAIVRALNL